MPPTLPAMTRVGAGKFWPWISARLRTTATLPAAADWLTTCTQTCFGQQQQHLAVGMPGAYPKFTCRGAQDTRCTHTAQEVRCACMAAPHQVLTNQDATPAVPRSIGSRVTSSRLHPYYSQVQLSRKTIRGL